MRGERTNACDLTTETDKKPGHASLMYCEGPIAESNAAHSVKAERYKSTEAADSILRLL